MVCFTKPTSDLKVAKASVLSLEFVRCRFRLNVYEAPCSSEGERSNLLLQVRVGSQCISPLYWALRSQAVKQNMQQLLRLGLRNSKSSPKFRCGRCELGPQAPSCHIKHIRKCMRRVTFIADGKYSGSIFPFDVRKTHGYVA